MKQLMLITLIAGLAGPAWSEAPTDQKIEEAVQRLVEGEAKNAEEIGAAAREAKQATASAARRVKKALTPLAQRLTERAKAEAPAVIDAVAEQRRASSKILSGCLGAFKKVADEVAK